MIEAAANPGKWDDWDHAFDDLRTSLSAGEKILRTPLARRDRRLQKQLTDYFSQLPARHYQGTRR